MKYNSLEEVALAYKVVCDELGRKPTRKELVARRKSGIEATALRYGGMYEVYKCLGINEKQRCWGHWTEEQVRIELKKFIDEYKKFPTQNDLKRNGKGGLLSGVNKHGGLNKFKIEFGYELTQVPEGYYREFANVQKVIEDCEEKIGKFPTITELELFNPGIKFAILKYHKNYTSVRKRLGQKLVRVPDGYWNDFENVKREIDIIIAEIGMFPSYRALAELAINSGLYSAINRLHGGLNDVRKKMGFRPNSKHKNENRVKNILERYFNEEEFVDNRRTDLYRRFGIELRDPFTNNYQELDRYYYNLKLAIEVQGEQHFKEVEYFARQKGMTPKEYREYIKKCDEAKAKQCKNQGIILILIDYKDNKEKILAKVEKYLKKREIPLPCEPDWEQSTKRRLDKILKEHGIITSDLIKQESMALYKELLDEFGSTQGARNHFGYDEGRIARDSWTEELVVEKLNNLIVELGRIPTKKEIQASDKLLYYGVVKHGGLRRFKKILASY